MSNRDCYVYVSRRTLRVGTVVQQFRNMVIMSIIIIYIYFNTLCFYQQKKNLYKYIDGRHFLSNQLKVVWGFTPIVTCGSQVATYSVEKYAPCILDNTTPLEKKVELNLLL